MTKDRRATSASKAVGMAAEWPAAVAENGMEWNYSYLQHITIPNRSNYVLNVIKSLLEMQPITCQSMYR